MYPPLEIIAPDGKKRDANCVNTEGAFRVIQSIPSPKAEPFKLWLAKVGYERVQEIEDPELAQKRMKEIYHEKGYSSEWILTMLGEATTTRITMDKDSRGFPRLKKDANEGGSVAGETRKNIEKKLGKSVVSGSNYLEKAEVAKRIEEKARPRAA